MLALELLTFWLLSPRLTDNHRQFVTLPNVMSEVRAVSLIGIAAVGTSLVILTGGIDLSVGTTLGLTAVTASLLLSSPGLQGLATGTCGIRSTHTPILGQKALPS